MIKEHKLSWLGLIQMSVDNFDDIEIVVPDELNMVVRVKNSPLIFKIKQQPDSFDIFSYNSTNYQPGFPLRFPDINFENYINKFDPDEIADRLDDWLKNVVSRYLNEINLPEPFLNSYANFSGKASISDDDLKSFTSEEKEQIKTGIEDFKKMVVENYEPIQDQLRLINERLDYLSKAVDRLNRFDWKAQAFSTLTSVAVNLAVDTETGKQLFNMFRQALSSIAGYLH